MGIVEARAICIAQMREAIRASKVADVRADPYAESDGCPLHVSNVHARMILIDVLII